MPVAPYDTDKYREWNRKRMDAYRQRIIIPLGDDWSHGLRYQTIEQERQNRRRRVLSIERVGRQIAELNERIAAWKAGEA